MIGAAGSALCVLLLLTSVATAFDGHRKGFVIGGGMGIAPISHWTTNFRDLKVSEIGLSGNGFIGYAWSNRDLFVLESVISHYHSSKAYDTPTIQSLEGVRWYHYFGDTKGAVFTSFGVGRLTFDTNIKTLYGTGLGYLAGIGVEALKHVQIGAYYYGSTNSNKYDVDSKHSVLTLLVTALAY